MMERFLPIQSEPIMSRKLFLSALTLAPLFAACSFNMATPPARSAFFGSPRVLPAGESAVTAEGTMAGQLFGPSLAGGSITYERGIANMLELIVTPTAGSIQDQSAYAGISLDFKQGLPDTRHVAFTYGAGYLWNEYAVAASGQAGILVGYENRFFVPTLSLMGFVSQPFKAETVCGTSGEQSDEACAKPTQTIGARIGLTTEIKFPGRVSLVPSAAFIPLQSRTHSFEMFQLSAGLRWEY
jgi:hypothetical protein